MSRAICRSSWRADFSVTFALAMLILLLPLFKKANAWRVKALEENG